jgi:hypothetical protein
VPQSPGDAHGSPADLRPAGGEPANGVDQDAFGAWYRWRHSRPFWGGLLVLLGGAEILLTERAPLPVVIHVGMQGLAGYLVPAIMLLCGLMLWFYPLQRTFYSVLAVLLALGSWITSNLGGFLVGMALGVVGGALAFAWTRGNDSRPPALLSPPPQRPEPSAGLNVILRPPADDTEPLPEDPGLGHEARDARETGRMAPCPRVARPAGARPRPGILC